MNSPFDPEYRVKSRTDKIAVVVAALAFVAMASYTQGSIFLVFRHTTWMFPLLLALVFGLLAVQTHRHKQFPFPGGPTVALITNPHRVALACVFIFSALAVAMLGLGIYFFAKFVIGVSLLSSL